jgi:hypothetical protein
MTSGVRSKEVSPSVRQGQYSTSVLLSLTAAQRAPYVQLTNEPSASSESRCGIVQAGDGAGGFLHLPVPVMAEPLSGGER